MFRTRGCWNRLLLQRDVHPAAGPHMSILNTIWALTLSPVVTVSDGNKIYTAISFSERKLKDVSHVPERKNDFPLSAEVWIHSVDLNNGIVLIKEG